MCRTLAILLALTVSAEAAPVPKELKRRSDRERMQGVWADEDVGTRWYIVGEKLFAGGADTAKKKGVEFGLALRPDSPLGDFDLSQFGNTCCVGIYKFVGDDLHVAYHGGGQPRPANFEPGDGKSLFILKRVPEAKK